MAGKAMTPEFTQQMVASGGLTTLCGPISPRED
jgi:hypothetical protein